jgi:hypothetical protein
VGASVIEKETIYQTYISKYNKSIDVVAANDAVISSRVEKLILADTENSLITRRELLSALDDIESVYREHFVGTELYREKIQKDILAALKDSVSGLFGDTGLSYPKIFTARYIPLKTGPYATYDEIKATSNSVNVVLSSDIAKRIDLSVVEALVGEYCEYGTKVHFASNVDEKELFVYRESKGARFSFAEILNELASEPKGYESYVKAHKAKKNYDTPMWDPSLIYEREGAVTLPFISAEMQKKYELSVAKAVMFALSDETLFTARDDDGNSVYFVDVELERVPVCLDGEPVHEGDVVSLMRWAYSNAEWVEEYAKAYETYADKCKKTVMSSGSASEGLYRSMLIERVALERIREPMLVLLDGLYKTDSLGVEGYADCIARTVYELVLGCCTERSGSLSESEALVYNGVIRRFFEYISERAGVHHAEKYAEWLNSQEIFMYYTVYNKFCEFKFDRQV